MPYIGPANAASVEPLPNGDLRVVLRFTGNAGEPEVRKTFLVGENTVENDVRYFIWDTIRELNGKRTFTIVQGQSIAHLARPAAPAPTAKQNWQALVARAQPLKGLTLTGAALTDYNALVASISSTYAAGFLDA